MTTIQATEIERWFARKGWVPFDFQRDVWNAYHRGESGLIHAATGAGKTYAAWLGPVQEWLDAAGDDWTLSPGLRVLWITPLRAVAADTVESLRAPLIDLGIPWTVESRTGDTSSSARARQKKRLPTALVTTPESLSLLLSQPDAEHLFSNLQAVVVDEWHELLASKRGVQTELCLARLRTFRPGLRTWGLSATLGNLQEALNALVGSTGAGRIVRGLEPKSIVIDSVIPARMDRFPWAGHLGLTLLPAVIDGIEQSTSALVFTNTRSQTEIWYQAMLDARPEWAGSIALHHGSLDPATRGWVEQGLKDGSLRAVVCTSSLDLGVDFAPVDRVFQIGSPKGVARLLQRAGRSGHQPGVVSRITCVPTHAFELVEVAAVREAAHDGLIEARPPVQAPMDVLVQHLVTVAAGGGFESDALFDEVRTTNAYRNLTRAEWQWAIGFVEHGGSALGAYPEYSKVRMEAGEFVVASRSIAARHRQSIGTIVSDPQVTVQYVKGGRIGSVDESFISRFKPGDTFIFAGKPLTLVRFKDLTAWVRRSTRKRGAIPRWTGTKLPISAELGEAVRRTLERAGHGETGVPELSAIQPILEVQRRWSRVPGTGDLLIERLNDREGHHLFIYPFEGRTVHEGLAAIVAYRLSRLAPITFAISLNDYGFELLSPAVPEWPADMATLFDPANLAADIVASLNATEMARRQFREIARIAGLVFPGYPGMNKSVRQVQASSNLFFDVFQQYDPANLLLDQSRREVLDRQLEQSRLAAAMHRLHRSTIAVVDVPRPTPLAFPILVARLSESISSESLADRVRNMTLTLERAAGAARG